MNEDYEIKLGKIDDRKVLDLLNETRDSWGDFEIFKWIFKTKPDVNKEINFFAVNDKKKYIGFERASYKELIFPNNAIRSKNIIVGKCSSVPPDFQGKGVYSNLIKIRDNYLKDKHSYLFGFVRKSNITFLINRKNGWNYRVLPLYMLIRSPKNVIRKYAKFLFEKNRRLIFFEKFFGNRINFIFSDGSVTLSKIFGNKSSKRLKLNIYISNFAVKNIVEELTGSLNIINFFKEILKLLFIGDISFYKNKNFKLKDYYYKKDFKIQIKDKLINEEIEEVIQTYNYFNKKYDIVFRRREKDIKHLLSYPKIKDIIVIKKNENIIGFSVIGKLKEENKNEIIVLDTIYKNTEVFKILIKEIEKLANIYEIDMVHMFSDILPSKKWSFVPETTVMWKSLNNDFELNKIMNNGKLKISMYDVF